MSNLSDDDISASRIHHADSTSSGATPVVASSATVSAVFAHLNAEGFSNQDQAGYIRGMQTLSAAA